MAHLDCERSSRKDLLSQRAIHMGQRRHMSCSFRRLRRNPMLARNEKVIAAAARSQPQEVELDRAPNGLLVDNANLTKLLGVKCGPALEDIIQIALLTPVQDLTSN